MLQNMLVNIKDKQGTPKHKNDKEQHFTTKRVVKTLHFTTMTK